MRRETVLSILKHKFRHGVPHVKIAAVIRVMDTLDEFDLADVIGEDVIDGDIVNAAMAYMEDQFVHELNSLPASWEGPWTLKD